MGKILVLQNNATFWSPHRVISSHQSVQNNIMPKRHWRASTQGVAAARSLQFETDDEYNAVFGAQRRKQQEALRDRQRDRTKRSRPKREREQAERREAAAAQKAAKATAAKAAVVDAARQRAAAEQRLAALKQRACA